MSSIYTDSKKNSKDKYIKVKMIKRSMSQLFTEDAKLIPFTHLKVVDDKHLSLFESKEFGSKLKLTGVSKGKGYAGVMKRWGFSGMPATHGQKDHARGGGSIGTQGQGKVVKGKKMAGRMGSEKITIETKFLELDKQKGEIKVRGSVPGARNSKIVVYLYKCYEN